MKTLNIFKILFYTILSCVIVFGIHSCKKNNISDSPGTFDPDGDIVIMAMALTDKGLSNDLRYIDISGGLTYDLPAASEQQRSIDFVLFNQSGTGFNLVTPQDIQKLAESESGRIMNNTWLNKNKGTIFKMEESTASNDIFKNAKTSGDLKQAYDQHIGTISGDAGVYGPGKSLEGVNKGDLIFFHSEDRQFYALLRVFKVDKDNGTIEFEIKLDNRNVTEVPAADPSNLMTVFETSFERPGQTTGYRYMDFSNGDTFDNVGVMKNQHQIDFVAFNSSSSGINLIVPSNESVLQGFGGGKVMNSDWLVKNDGEFLKLNASAEADSLYLFTINNEMVRDAYQHVKLIVENTADYDTIHNGPGGLLRDVQEGDVFVFRSESRNIYAIAKITGLAPGNLGSLAISAKVDNSNKKDIAAPPNREFNMESSGYGSAHFIDFLGGVDYDETSAKPVSETIDLIFTRGSSTYVNLFPTNNEAALKAFSSSIWPSRIAEWEVRNDVLLVNLGNDPIYETFREGMPGDMKEAYENGGAPSARLTKIATNDVILFYSIDRKFYCAIKIINAIDAGTVQFKYKVARE